MGSRGEPWAAGGTTSRRGGGVRPLACGSEMLATRLVLSLPLLRFGGAPPSLRRRSTACFAFNVAVRRFFLFRCSASAVHRPSRQIMSQSTPAAAVLAFAAAAPRAAALFAAPRRCTALFAAAMEAFAEPAGHAGAEVDPVLRDGNP